VVLRGLVVEGRFLGGPIPSVAAEDPPSEADDPAGGDEKGKAHEQPGGHPFAGEEEHDSNYRQDGDRLAPLGC
jgi:hypothetical protein